MNTVLRDVIVPGLGRGDLQLTQGRARALSPAPPGPSPRIVIPALVEAHCHLDKCHTLHRLGDVGGDLMAAITAQRADKVHWTTEDIRHRAARGLAELVASGCRIVRSHVDWGDGPEPPLAWQVLGDLAQDDAPGLLLERAGLVGIAALADRSYAETVARTIARDGGVLGTMLLGHPETATGLANMFDLAGRHGLKLDFHVDEGLGDPSYTGLEAIADAALAHGFQGPILCGHACALMDQPPDAVRRIADKLARAGIAVAALPTTNLYLQGRTTGTPDRRGLTRLRELHAAGVPIVIGSDNVADAFCPLGAHDPMAALNLAVLAGHLDPPLDRWLPSITDTAARALGHDPQPIIGSPATRLRLSHAPDLATLISGRAGPLEPLTHHLETAA